MSPCMPLDKYHSQNLWSTSACRRNTWPQDIFKVMTSWPSTKYSLCPKISFTDLAKCTFVSCNRRHTTKGYLLVALVGKYYSILWVQLKTIGLEAEKLAHPSCEICTTEKLQILKNCCENLPLWLAFSFFKAEVGKKEAQPNTALFWDGGSTKEHLLNNSPSTHWHLFINVTLQEFPRVDKYRMLINIYSSLLTYIQRLQKTAAFGS